MLFVTPLYAALIALVFVLLSIRTLRLRRRFSVGIGDGDQQLLARASRAHANFAEYVPIALLLIFFLEMSISTALWIHLLCVVLLVGRVIHAYGISQIDENYAYRVAGMALTFTAIITAAVGLLLTAIWAKV